MLQHLLLMQHPGYVNIFIIPLHNWKGTCLQAGFCVHERFCQREKLMPSAAWIHMENVEEITLFPVGGIPLSSSVLMADARFSMVYGFLM